MAKPLYFSVTSPGSAVLPARRPSSLCSLYERRLRKERFSEWVELSGLEKPGDFGAPYFCSNNCGNWVTRYRRVEVTGMANTHIFPMVDGKRRGDPFFTSKRTTISDWIMYFRPISRGWSQNVTESQGEPCPLAMPMVQCPHTWDIWHMETAAGRCHVITAGNYIAILSCWQMNWRRKSRGSMGRVNVAWTSWLAVLFVILDMETSIKVFGVARKHWGASTTGPTLMWLQMGSWPGWIWVRSHNRIPWSQTDIDLLAKRQAKLLPTLMTFAILRNSSWDIQRY